ncbi:MAG: hypothetical protein JWO38_4871 [Gemmataceae bacterium]|nr:hypothetical protein [Gemmataceae bacterium]
MMRHGCICDNVRKGEPYVYGRDCGHCWSWWHRPEIRKAMGGNPAECVPVQQAPALSLPVVRSPCVHEGKVIETCKLCGNQEGRHVRQCFEPAGARDRCTREYVGPHVQPCASCPDYEAEAPPADAVATHRAGLEARLAAPPAPYPGGSGRGIVTAGEGIYWPGVVVLVRLLREAGCTLPVEVYHRPAAGGIRADQLAGLGVDLIALDDECSPPGIPADHPEWAGWAAKLEALAQTRFETALWLDADLYPVRDPSFLLDLAGPTGFACWTDTHPTASNHLKWPEVWPAGPGDVPPIQSGQVVIRRPDAWRELSLARWICHRAAHYFVRMLGDQDAMRVAFAATGRVPYVLGTAEHVPGAKHTYLLGHAGATVFVHRSGTKLVPYGLPLENRVQALYASLLPAPPPPGPVVVNMGCQGVGDGVQGMLAVAALARDNPRIPIIYKCGPRALPFVRLFEFGTTEVRAGDWDHNASRILGGPDRQANADYHHELTTRGAKPRIRRYMDNIGAVGDPVLPRLRDPAAVRAAGRDHAGAVVLCPFSYWSDREYSVPGWLTLERLLAAAGYRTVVLADDPQRAAALTSPKVIGAGPERVAGIMLNAACVVGLDSGLSHLAGALGAPAVVLTGQTTGECVFSCYPSVRWVTGPLACRGCYWQRPYRKETCSPQCPSLNQITPAQILAAVDGVVLPATADRSLVSADRLAVIRDEVLRTNHLPGDVAEVGVYRGGTARLIGRYATPATLHLFDTFAGLPADDAAGGHAAGEFAAAEAETRAYVDNPRALYHVGVFPGTAPDRARYRFAHVDGDTYQTTLAACDYFAPRMTAGGVIVWDDYNWPLTPGVARALHERFGGRVERGARDQAIVRF